MRYVRGLLIALLATLIGVTSTASATNWYAGGWHPSAYGAWAYITAPATPVHIYNIAGLVSGTAHWVSLPPPDWIQTGWYYHPILGDTIPKRFVETCINNCYGGRYIDDTTLGIHNWGTTVSYMISFQPGTGNRWCAYIAGVQKYCQAIRTPPSTIEILSEVQYNSRNEVDTYFNNAYYKDSNNVWRAFNQSAWFSQSFPYAVQVFQPWNYRTYRVSTFEIFLPLVKK